MRVHDLLDHWAMRVPDEVYATDGERSVTWEQMRAWSCQIGNWLATQLEPGDRFALLERNSLEMIAVYFAASRAGVVVVPLNYRLAAPEWRFIIGDSKSRLVIVHTEYAAALRAAVPADMPGAVLRGVHDRWASLEDTVAGHDTGEVPVNVSPDSTYHQMYTSGTTGNPKGALLTHRAVFTNSLQIHAGIGASRVTILLVMPMFHAGAEVPLFAFTAGGCRIRVMRDFESTRVLRAIADERIQLAGFAPAMIQELIADPAARDLDFRHLELVLYGSSPIAVEVLRRAMDLFGCDFLQAYGMTETCAIATILSPEDHRKGLAGRPQLLTSAGRAVLGTDLRIIGAEGKPVSTGEVGEILVRGPQLMSGYWQLEEATAEALADGWMHTGDSGYLDREGFLYVSDRMKDMIISGGENIYPRQIEDVLFTLPGVRDAAVIGVPSERWGEVPLAIVVRDDGAELDEDSIMAHCRKHLARYKCPSAVEFVMELPRSTAGKVLKRELRAPFWADRARAIN